MILLIYYQPYMSLKWYLIQILYFEVELLIIVFFSLVILDRYFHLPWVKVLFLANTSLISGRSVTIYTFLLQYYSSTIFCWIIWNWKKTGLPLDTKTQRFYNYQGHWYIYSQGYLIVFESAYKTGQQKNPQMNVKQNQNMHGNVTWAICEYIW